MITKWDLVGRDRRKDAKGRRKSYDGGGKSKKPQSGVWACNAVKGICPMKEHPRIRCAVHGTRDEAMKCIQKSIEAKAAGGIG